MQPIPAFGIEARRWSVVFHRQSKHLFFRLIAMGEFKHVSALAWIPELGQWWIYDVGFRRTSLKALVDGPAAQSIIAAIVKGNAVVTIDVREDDLPWMRLGMFCTTAVAHLIGLRSGALRPDALYRHLVAQGGIVSDDAGRCANDAGRPEPAG
jgi:hypothetical protein